MTWDAHHRRDDVLREVMAYVETRRDGHLPWAEVRGTGQAFDTPEDLLGALQMRWHTRLTGAIDHELTEQPWDLEQAVVHAWRNLSAQMPGVRAVLDVHADEGTMPVARRKEHALLATASGLCSMTDAAAPALGEAVEQRARAVTVQQHQPVEPAGRSWLSRLRHALAA